MNDAYDEGRVYADEQTELLGLSATHRYAISRDFGLYYAEQNELTPVGLWRQYSSDIGGHWESYARTQVVRFDREGWV